MHNLSLALKVAVTCAVPLLACSTYYTLDRLGASSTFVVIAASLAWPALLIGLATTASLVLSGKRHGALLWACSFANLVPLVFLAYIWL
jgi:hypothetical protein